MDEFFGKFQVPKTMKKAESTMKCNFFYFRTNYFILVGVCLGTDLVSSIDSGWWRECYHPAIESDLSAKSSMGMS